MADDKEPASTPPLRFPASLPGFDPELVPSVAESLQAVSSITVIDQAAVQRAAQTFQTFQPVVGPQISEALSKVTVTLPQEAIQAMLPAFNFAKALENVDLSAITGLRVVESLQTLYGPQKLAAFPPLNTIETLPLPPNMTAALASQFDRTAKDAVALAEVDEVAAGVEDAIGIDLRNMTPAKRRELAVNVVILIGAFLLLAAWLTQDDPKNPTEGAGLFLTCAAAYVNVYWRLIGKFEE